MMLGMGRGGLIAVAVLACIASAGAGHITGRWGVAAELSDNRKALAEVRGDLNNALVQTAALQNSVTQYQQLFHEQKVACEGLVDSLRAQVELAKMDLEAERKHVDKLEEQIDSRRVFDGQPASANDGQSF
jgi:uncharacterized membrane-anchored protein YhcB (DUF1043 family)